MPDLSAFPITNRWPAEHPDRLQLYSAPTPNGVKVSIALEETGIPYEPHFVNIMTDETWGSEFLGLNPNGKIPAILDPDGPGRTPLALWESGAILIYLAEKSGTLLPADAAGRYEAIQWVMWQMGGLGPMLGQVGFFHKFAGRDYEDKRPRDRYAKEASRLIRVLDARVADRQWVMGNDFTIADIAMLGWVRTINGFYEAGALLGYDDLVHLPAWLERGQARPAVQKGLTIPNRHESGVAEPVRQSAQEPALP